MLACMPYSKYTLPHFITLYHNELLKLININCKCTNRWLNVIQSPIANTVAMVMYAIHCYIMSEKTDTFQFQISGTAA